MTKASNPQRPQALADAAKRERQRKDRLRLWLIPLAAKGSVRQADAADMLKISVRQVQNLVSGYRDIGEAALLHKGRGKPSNHRLDPEIRSRAIGIIRAKFMGSGPRPISEELRLKHDIVVHPETIRRWMIAENLWKPNDPSQAKRRRPRERRAGAGEPAQMDASERDEQFQ